VHTSVPSDWSAYTKEILRSDGSKAPDIVVSVMQTPYNIGLFTAVKRSGYRGVLTDPTDYDPGLLAKSATKEALDGVHILLTFEPFETRSAAMKQFKADIKKASGGKSVPLNMHMMTGYMSADLFLSIAQKAGRNLTVASFQKTPARWSATAPCPRGRRSRSAAAPSSSSRTGRTTSRHPSSATSPSRSSRGRPACPTCWPSC
jgi:ABC-type branched-subunit amino acid transport system substrate-binding protein